MRFDFYFHFEFANPLVLSAIKQLKELITMNQQETQVALQGVQAALTEAGTEIAEKLQKLQDDLAAAGNLTPENEALLTDIGTRARALADIVPNPAP